jgi:hypothetical protein
MTESKTYELHEIPAWAGVAMVLCPIVFWSLIGYGAYRVVRRVTGRNKP